VALELITAGESHGPELVAVLTGLPAGLALDRTAIDAELARRQHGHGGGGRQKIERDRVEVRAGLRDGSTLGSPLLLAVPNRDWENWAAVMDPWAVDPERAARRRLTAPRPGHADLAGGWKYGHESDLRNVLERASARETAARVAAGAVCRQLLARCGVRLRSGVLALGGVSLLEGPPTMADLERVDPDSPLTTVAPSASRRWLPGSTPPRRRATRWAASSGRSRPACRPASAPTRAGRSGSTANSPRR
jgi:chorismate synthase